MFAIARCELSTIRSRQLGFIFQSCNLIAQLDVIENIEVPLFYQGVLPRESRQRAIELAELVGLGDRLGHRPTQLSGGQQQRVAIARSLANDPLFILADEPTGSVDSKMSNQILDLFRELNRSIGITIVIVTHDPQLAKKVDRVAAIRDGKISSEMLRRRSYAEELAELAQEETEEESHVEYAILDKAGRLQVPAGYLESIGVKNSNKVRVELNEGRIVLLPPEPGEEEKE